MKAVLKFLKIFGIILCSAGCIWFLLPLLRGGFALGAIFGFSVCAAGIFVLLIYRKAVASGKIKKYFIRSFSVLYCLGLLWALVLTVMMLSVHTGEIPAETNVIVLGSRVYSAERMGVSLSNRVDKAYEYLSENPGASCIVTGGQGSDEPCPEALTQKNALIRMGIAKDRIYMEDKSHNTRENMDFSKEIAEENALGSEFIIVTQQFHMYRALKLAQNAGFTPYALMADTDMLLFPEYYGRELLSLTKWIVESMFIK